MKPRPRRSKPKRVRPLKATLERSDKGAIVPLSDGTKLHVDTVRMTAHIEAADGSFREVAVPTPYNLIKDHGVSREVLRGAGYLPSNIDEAHRRAAPLGVLSRRGPLSAKRPK